MQYIHLPDPMIQTRSAQMNHNAEWHRLTCKYEELIDIHASLVLEYETIKSRSARAEYILEMLKQRMYSRDTLHHTGGDFRD